MKTEENNEECDETGECCMCYQTHLNEKLPEIICENPSCESYFHTECLYQVIIHRKDKEFLFINLFLVAVNNPK